MGVPRREAQIELSRDRCNPDIIFRDRRSRRREFSLQLAIPTPGALIGKHRYYRFQKIRNQGGLVFRPPRPPRTVMEFADYYPRHIKRMHLAQASGNLGIASKMGDDDTGIQRNPTSLAYLSFRSRSQ